MHDPDTFRYPRTADEAFRTSDYASPVTIYLSTHWFARLLRFLHPWRT